MIANMSNKVITHRCFGYLYCMCTYKYTYVYIFYSIRWRSSRRHQSQRWNDGDCSFAVRDFRLSFLQFRLCSFFLVDVIVASGESCGDTNCVALKVIDLLYYYWLLFAGMLENESLCCCFLDLCSFDLQICHPQSDPANCFFLFGAIAFSLWHMIVVICGGNKLRHCLTDTIKNDHPRFILPTSPDCSAFNPLLSNRNSWSPLPFGTVVSANSTNQFHALFSIVSAHRCLSKFTLCTHNWKNYSWDSLKVIKI